MRIQDGVTKRPVISIQGGKGGKREYITPTKYFRVREK
jgi:hypothetical protein